MTEPRRPPRPPADVSDLVGDDVPPAEVERLRRVDRMLRSVPPPPELPPSLAGPAAGLAGARERLWTSRRVAAALAVAAALSALFFGLGMRAGGGDGFDERAAVPMEATSEARGASALIRLGEPDADGNWPLRLEVSGLPPLPRGGYYVLWLARDGEYGGTCGTFRVADDGTAEVEMSASYRLRDFDAWVVTAQRPGDPADAEPRWLLQGEIPRT